MNKGIFMKYIKLIFLLLFGLNSFAESNFDFSQYCDKISLEQKKCFNNYKTKDSFSNNFFEVLKESENPKFFNTYEKNLLELIEQNGKILEEYSNTMFSGKSKMDNYKRYLEIIDNAIKTSPQKTQLLDIKTKLYLSYIKSIDKSKFKVDFNERSYLKPFYEDYKKYIFNNLKNDENFTNLTKNNDFETILNKEYNDFFTVVFENNTDIQMLKYRYDLNFVDTILFYIKMYILKILDIEIIRQSFYKDLAEIGFQNEYTIFNSINNNTMEIEKFTKKRN